MLPDGIVQRDEAFGKGDADERGSNAFLDRRDVLDGATIGSPASVLERPITFSENLAVE